MNKDYTWKSPEGVIDLLLTLPVGTSVDFTFDPPEDYTDEKFEPSAWYGVKIMEIFGIKTLNIGIWGGGDFEAHEIYEEDDKYDIFDDYCAEYGQNYMLCVSNKYNGE